MIWSVSLNSMSNFVIRLLTIDNLLLATSFSAIYHEYISELLSSQIIEMYTSTFDMIPWISDSFKLHEMAQDVII